MTALLALLAVLAPMLALPGLVLLDRFERAVLISPPAPDLPGLPPPGSRPPGPGRSQPGRPQPGSALPARLAQVGLLAAAALVVLVAVLRQG